MKRMKKIASIVLAMAMVLAMSIPVMAADNDPHTITVKQNADDKTVHQYAAYQIFAGDLATVDGEKVLSNIIWGSGVDDPDALLAELKADEDDVFSKAFAECKTAADVARALSEFPESSVSESTSLDFFARIVEKHLSAAYESMSGSGDVEIEVLGSGYYLVQDIRDSVEENGAYTRALLEVGGDSDMIVKSEVPSGDKQVYLEGTDGTFVPGDGNYSSIGSHVSYVITSKVPNWVGYDYYFFVMNDTLSKGLTFDGAENVTITVGGTELTQGEQYYVYSEKQADGSTFFRIAFDDIMKFTVGADIVVTYSATVNDQVEIGSTGNPNEWTLTYSNNPGEDYEGRKDSNRPGLPLDEENGPVLLSRWY